MSGASEERCENLIQVQEEDHGLGEIERERTDKSHEDDVLARHLLSHELRFAGQLLVAGDLAETSCAAEEDVVGACLWKGKE